MKYMVKYCKVCGNIEINSINRVCSFCGNEYEVTKKNFSFKEEFVIMIENLNKSIKKNAKFCQDLYKERLDESKKPGKYKARKDKVVFKNTY